MADEHARAIREWLLLGIGDGASLTGAYVALDVSAGAVALEGVALGVAGLSAAFAVAAAPIILVGLGGAILATSVESSRQWSDAATAVGRVTSPSTLAITALTAPFNQSDPFVIADVFGPVLDLGIGLNAATGLEQLAAEVTFGTAVPGIVARFGGSQAQGPGAPPTNTSSPANGGPFPTGPTNPGDWLGGGPGMGDLSPIGDPFGDPSTNLGGDASTDPHADIPGMTISMPFPSVGDGGGASNPGNATGTDETGTDETGTGASTGTDPTGTGTGSTGTDATGTDATGTDATGTDATGTDDLIPARLPTGYLKSGGGLRGLV